MMKAGTYWVGDLCYVMSDVEWDEICSLTIKGNGCLDGEFQLKDGRRFCMFSTKYGDGEYLDQYGNNYGVDSGTIGCIEVNSLRGDNGAINSSNLGSFVVFTKDFSVSGGRNDREWDGVIKIGHLNIETDPVEEYN